MNEHKKEMLKLFNSFRYKHRMGDVVTDFLEITALSIANSCDKVNFNKREERYFQVIKKYNKEELNTIAKLFAELVLALEDEPTDILGEIFMQLDLGDKWKGQFFTPMSVANVCAEFTLGDITQEYLNEKEFISVNEPTCGGGAMVIGIVNAFRKKNFNFQQQMYVIAQDLDIRAVHMCYIQLSLLGVPAIVMHSNSLTVEVFDEFKTPFYILFGWEHKRLKRREREKKEEAVLNINSKIKDLVNKVERSLSA